MAQIRNFVLFALISAVIITIANAEYECNPASCHGATHSMCIYQKPGPACNGKPIEGLSEQERQAVLNSHNELRQRVASGSVRQGNPGPQPGGIIPPLEWDDELAEIAQAWARQCAAKHDACRNTKELHVGQSNAYSARSDKYPDIPEVVELQWFAEVKNFDSRRVKKYDYHDGELETRHYTQLVWASTKKIGCGAVKWRENLPQGKYFSIRLICNYGPGGNIMTLPVYSNEQPIDYSTLDYGDGTGSGGKENDDDGGDDNDDDDDDNDDGDNDYDDNDDDDNDDDDYDDDNDDSDDDDDDVYVDDDGISYHVVPYDDDDDDFDDDDD